MAGALVGTFTAAEGAGNLTTGSRTTTAGNLITGHAASYEFSGTGGTIVISDNKSNSYTEPNQLEINVGGDGVNVAMAYNANGTRGTTHTVSTTFGGGSNAHTLAAHEWSGIEATPTVVSATNTGTSTAVSASATAGAASLYIGTMVYGGVSTTIAVNGSTQASETDENSDFQAQAVAYRVTLTGANSVAWTLAASRQWAALVSAFTEAGGGGVTTTKTMTETTVIGDSALDVAQRIRLQSDATTINDQLVYGARRGNVTSDGIIIGDAVVYGARRGVTTSEALILQDEDIQWTRRTRLASDTLDITDGFISWRRLARVAQDSIDLLDGYSRTVTGAGTVYGKVLSDAVSVTDGIITWRRLVRLLADNADLLDSFSKTLIGVGIVYAKVMSDTTILVDDVGQRWVLRTSNLTDTIGLSDVLLRALARIRILGEDIEFSDGAIRFLRAVRVSDDTIDISDALIRTFYADQLFTVALVFGHTDPFRFSSAEPALRFGGQ